jgi:hypothetical protein
MSDDAKQCPWCERWALKDEACNYIFACGLSVNGFKIGEGCGKPWCWECGKKFCGQYIDPNTGAIVNSRTCHDEVCCLSDPDFKKEEFCLGGHNSHCGPRWQSTNSQPC